MPEQARIVALRAGTGGEPLFAAASKRGGDRISDFLAYVDGAERIDWCVWYFFQFAEMDELPRGVRLPTRALAMRWVL